MRVTGWTAATLRAQPARLIRAHFVRIFVGLVWSPELAEAAMTPAAPREAFGDLGDWGKARVAQGKAVEAFTALQRALWPEGD